VVLKLSCRLLTEEGRRSRGGRGGRGRKKNFSNCNGFKPLALAMEKKKFVPRLLVALA
jgi:hypothetical protein